MLTRALRAIARPNICVSSEAKQDARRAHRMLFAPFLFIYVLICLALLAGLFILIQFELISYAFQVLGLSPRGALLVLLASLIGSYINIPLYTIGSGPIPTATTASNFGMIYSVPIQYAGSSTTI